MKKLFFAGMAVSAVAMTVMATGAEARDRWYPRFPRLYPTHLPAWMQDDPADYRDSSYDQYDQEIDDYAVRNLLRRQRDVWWMDSGDLEPSYDAPARPLKKKTVKKAAAPVVKTTKPKTARVATATAPAASKKPPQKVASAATGDGLQTASVSKPAATGGKGIGCSAGAAIVTGYGFGQVKPKACTGSTYAYDAQRGGKAYQIKLSAASGEILDVKKTP